MDGKNAATTNGLQLRPLTGALGVEVLGLSLLSLTSPDIEQVRNLIDTYSVVIFPGQGLDAEQHLALARQLGEPQIHAYHAAEGPNPELLIMRSSHALADFWHSDETYDTSCPTFQCCAWSSVRQSEAILWGSTST